MENQHRKIKGYRELSQDEIDLMKKIKKQGEQLDKLVREIATYHACQTGDEAIDIAWLNDGEMSLKKGIMSLVRSVAKPESF